MKRRLLAATAGIAMLVAIPGVAGADQPSTTSAIHTQVPAGPNGGPIPCKGIVMYRLYFQGHGYFPYVFRGYC